MSRLLGRTKAGHVQTLLLSSCVIACAASPSLAQSSPPDDGGMFQWATIGAVNNPAYNGTPNGGPGSVNPAVLGRGSVSYEYRISRNELTTSQLLPFYQAAYGFSNPAVTAALAELGARASIHQESTFAGGILFNGTLPDGSQQILLRGSAYANTPATLTWREAALFCNWMHNGRANTPEAFLTGAYDTSTWRDLPGGGFADAPTRMPGARFWIPNIDEHLKASHYDPNRYGPNQGGYWLRGTSSDTAPIFARPEQGGQALLGNDSFLGGGPTSVGMFPTVQSPWGLLDVAGGMGEWVEDAVVSGFDPSLRYARFAVPFGANGDTAGYAAPLSAFLSYGNYTFRIASSVPSPGSISVIGLGLLVVSRRRR